MYNFRFYIVQLYCAVDSQRSQDPESLGNQANPTMASRLGKYVLRHCEQKKKKNKGRKNCSRGWFGEQNSECESNTEPADRVINKDFEKCEGVRGSGESARWIERDGGIESGEEEAWSAANRVCEREREIFLARWSTLLENFSFRVLLPFLSLVLHLVETSLVLLRIRIAGMRHLIN